LFHFHEQPLPEHKQSILFRTHADSASVDNHFQENAMLKGTAPICIIGFFVLALCGALVAAGPGTITTIAGNHNLGPGYGGDGGPPSSAQFRDPQTIVVGTSGNLYIVDGGNNVIRKVTPSGTIAAVLAHGGLDGYTGAAVDGAGDLYALNGTLWKLTPDGTVTALPGGSAGATGVAVDAAGNLYIADRINDVVRKITPGGASTTIAGSGPCPDPELNICYSGDGGPATNAQLLAPWEIALDGSGNLYIADTGNNVIRKVTPGGTISTIAGKYAFVSRTGPVGGDSGDGGPANSAQLNSPYSVAVDVVGNLYIADMGNNVIRKVNPGGTITTIVGNHSQGYSGDSGPAINAQLAAPRGVAVDNAGNLYVVDTGNYVVRKIETVLNLSTAALPVRQIGIAANFHIRGAENACSPSGQTMSSATNCFLGITPMVSASISGGDVLTYSTQCPIGHPDQIPARQQDAYITTPASVMLGDADFKRNSLPR
jgi:NHL repeat